jgi:hypothetical protein
MEHDPNLTSDEASEHAAHKAKSAQMAVEIAREVQLAEAIKKTAEQTKEALIEGLKEVFGEGDEKRDPDQMTILVRRIPLICQDIKQIHSDVADIKDGNKWIVRIVVGAVIVAILKLVILP